MRIGVFGGTFNPIHKGHIRASLRFYDEAALDRLLVIPDRIPPHKEGTFAPEEDRLAMCRLCYDEKREVGERNITVSDMEIRREGKSYTVVTITELKEQYPEAEIFLYVGSDMFYTLESWYRGAELLGMCGIYCMAREENEAEKLCAYAERYKTLYGTEVILSEAEPTVISSTCIRNEFATGEYRKNTSFTKNLLTAEVRRYIMKNHLYR